MCLPCCWATPLTNGAINDGVRTSCDSRSSSLTYGPQTARTWIQSITLFRVPFNRRSINVNDSRQSTSWSSRSSLGGANQGRGQTVAAFHRSRSGVSGVAGLSASSSYSSSKTNTLNIWCKNCRMWQVLWTITERVDTLFPLVVNFLKCVVTEVILFSILALWDTWHFTS